MVDPKQNSGHCGQRHLIIAKPNFTVGRYRYDCIALGEMKFGTNWYAHVSKIHGRPACNVVFTGLKVFRGNRTREFFNFVCRVFDMQ